MSAAREAQDERVKLAREAAAHLRMMAGQIVSPRKWRAKMLARAAAIETLADDFVLMRQVAELRELIEQSQQRERWAALSPAEREAWIRDATG